MLFSISFFLLTYRRFEWGIFVALLLLPTYLIRFQIGPIPSTLLEIMIVIVIGVWFVKYTSLPTIKKYFSLILTAKLSRNEEKNISLYAGIVLFLLAATISIFTSSNIRAALGEWKAFYIEPFLLFLVIVSVAKQFRHSSILQFLILPLTLCGLATSLLAIYQHFTGFLVPYSFWANQDTYRVTAWYGYPNAVGLFLAPLVPLALFLVQQSWNTISSGIRNTESGIHTGKSRIPDSVFLIQTICCVLFIPCAALAIIFSKGTGPLLGVAASIVFLLLYYKKTRLATCLVSLVGIVSLVSFPGVRQELLMQNRSGQIHVAIWKETAYFLTDHPIAGAGLASYATKIVPYHTRVNGEGIEIFSLPHNLLLSIWVNTGIVGLTGFIMIITWFFRISFQLTRSPVPTTYTLSPSPYLLASMTALLVTGLADTPYIKNDLSLFFWVLLALMFILTQPAHNNSANY